MEIYRRGNRVKAFDVKDRQGELILTYPIRERETSWYTLRAEDVEGHWAVTSPIYFEPRNPQPRPAASVLLLEISNISRYASLRREFFAHLIATVSPGQQLTEIQLVKDGAPLQHFTPAGGNQLASGKIPVTGLYGDYAPGWIWFPEPIASTHFQADYPVTGSGWYSLCATTAGGKRLESDAVYFDAANPHSQELSAVNLVGADTRLQLWGYGEGNAAGPATAAEPSRGVVVSSQCLLETSDPLCQRTARTERRQPDHEQAVPSCAVSTVESVPSLRP